MQVLVRRRRVTALAVGAIAIGLLQVMPQVPAASAASARTLLVSSPSGSTVPERGASETMAVSGNGRYVAFTTTAGLDLRDTNGDTFDGEPAPGPEYSTDVYRKDLTTGALVLVTRDPEGNALGRSQAEEVAISDDGAVVVSYFQDPATPQTSAIYAHRVGVEPPIRVDENPELETAGFGPSFFSVSDDGTRVAFISYRPLTRDGGSGVYVRDLARDTMTFVAPADGAQVALSGDGTRVAYQRTTGSDTRLEHRLYVRDVAADSVEQLVNDGTSSNFADLAGLLGPDAVSRDGRQVAYWSDGDAFGDDPAVARPRQVWVYDAEVDDLDGRTRLASGDAAGVAGNAPSGGSTNDWPKGALSADGSRVAFTSQAGFGLPGVSGGSFVKDLTDGGIQVASLSTGGAPLGVEATTLSSDGRSVGFVTTAAATPQDDNGAPDVYVHELPSSLRDLALTVAPSAQRAGVSDVATDSIDVGLLPVGGDGGVASAPLHSSPLHSSPLHSSPLHSSPLHSSPFRSSPLHSSPLHSSPLHSSPIPLPLSSVPVFVDGGWPALLAGTRYEGVALQSVTLQQAIDVPDGDNPRLAALTLGDIDVTATPLGRWPLQAFLFAGVPVGKLSLTRGAQHCDVLRLRFTCDAATTTLQDLIAQGATASDLGFVSSLPVDGADLTGSVMDQYDVGSVDVERLGLGQIPVGSLPPGMVGATPCAACATLLDVVEADALSDDYTLTRLGRLLAPSRPETAGMTLGALVRSVVDPSKLSYAGVDLAGLVAQGPFDPARSVTYTATASLSCTDTEDLSLDVRLPQGFRYVPGSTTLSFGGTDGGYDDPSNGRGARRVSSEQRLAPTQPTNVLSWALPSCSAGQEALRLSFDASPGVVLGTFTSDARLSNRDGETGRYDEISVAGAAPVTVGDAYDGASADDAASDETTIPLLADHLYVSHISSPTDIDTYRLPAGLPLGTRVTAVLSHLKADFDLFLDGPTADPLRSSPLHSSPLHSSPLEDLGAPDTQGGDVIEPENLQDLPLASSSLSRSATAGTEDEQVTAVLTRATTLEDPVTVSVTHHLGSSSASPYLLQVTMQAPVELECPDAGPTVPFLAAGGGTPGTLPDPAAMTAEQKRAVRTLFLVNQERLGDAYGPLPAQEVMTQLRALSGRPEVGGLVLPVEARPAVAEAYATWDADRCNPEAPNDVVRAIGDVVDEYAAQLPELRYITFVGDDDIVPFARIPDGGTLSNQLDYHQEVKFGGQDNAISAAFGRGYVLSDNPLLAKQGVDFLGHQLPVPDYAGGRLVETPTEILGTIEQYLARGHILKDRTLVTGYDFLSDLTPVLHETLTGEPATTGVPPERFLNTESWDRAALADALAAAPDIAGINAHYDHSNALPALGNAAASPSAELFSSADLGASALPPGALLFSLGCQSGLSVPGRAWTAATTDEELQRLQDFAQVLAQKQANGFLGNTGFGYGDSVLLAYSERFLELFTRNLDGSMTVAQAITRAKQQYLEDGLVGVYDEKVLNEATFYGLPFVTVGPKGEAAPAPGASGAVAAAAVAGEPGTLFGTPVQGFSTGTIAYDAPRVTPRGTYYTVTGEQPLVEHWRPVQPAIQQPLPPAPAGSTIGDVWFTGLRSLDDAAPGAFDPVFSAPTVDAATSSPEPLVRSVAFPVSLGTVTPRGSLALFPGQYRSGDVAGKGTQLRFASMDYKVFYPRTLDADRPTFRSVDATAQPTSTLFRVGITGAQGAAVLAKPVSSSLWVEVPLAQTSPGVWTGSIGQPVAEYFVQAANEGRVGTTRAKGLDFTPVAADPELVVEPVGMEVTPTTAPWSRQPVTVRSKAGVVEARLVGAPAGTTTASSGAPEATGSFQPLPLTISPDGVHEVEYRTAGSAETSSLLVAIDATLPTVTITNPTEGGTVTSANQTASFSCADATSGIASCRALDPTALKLTAGPHTFRVEAVDRAGAVTVRTVSYRGLTYVFEGFFAPVDNAPVVNVVQPGSTVPVKFRLKRDGAVVTDTTTVTAIQVVPLASCPGGLLDLVEESAPATAPPGLVYDATAQRFQYNWRTSRTAKGCHKLSFSFADGSSRHALFSFR